MPSMEILSKNDLPAALIYITSAECCPNILSGDYTLGANMKMRVTYDYASLVGFWAPIQ